MAWVVIAAAAVSQMSSNRAAKAQAGALGRAGAASQAAANEAMGIQKDVYDQQLEWQKPWYDAGTTSLNKLSSLANNYQKFGMDQFQQDPGYAFRLSEGQKALDQQAAARGGLISGNALRAAAKYGQDMGSQEYQNAFNRYQIERASELAPLESLAGMGQSAADSMGNWAGQYGSNTANILTGNAVNQGNMHMAQGNVRATQYQNTGKNITSALNSFGSMYGGGAAGGK